MAALIQFASGAPGIKYRLDKRMFSIGRNSADNDISLPCAFVSKRHALIEIVENIMGDGYDFFLEDLGSTNHTYVNDTLVQRVKLRNGDVIRIGKTNFKFDGTLDQQSLEALHVQIEEPAASSQSSTFNFSRRLRTLGVDT
jgi:pSer/pThr/pTyr-binding forkhead associated (FHA) protein